MKPKNYQTLYLPFCRTGMVSRTVLLPPGLCRSASLSQCYLLLQMCSPVPGQPASKLGHRPDTRVYTNLSFHQKKNFTECLKVRENRQSGREKRNCQTLTSNADRRRVDLVPGDVACFVFFTRRLFHSPSVSLL